MESIEEKYKEAKELKCMKNKYGQRIENVIEKCLTPEEYSDYEHHLKMRARLNIELHEVEDKIVQSYEQLSALKESLEISERSLSD